MSEEMAEPPMAWRYAGSQVRLWREEAGLTREQLAAECNYGVEYVKSMEYGRRKPTRRLLEIADAVCGAKGKLLAATEYLKPEKFPSRAREFMAAEAEALAIVNYEALLIPGLLQDEPYLRALMVDTCPPLDEEEIETRVRARLERKERMRTRRTVMHTFVIYEAALRSAVGGPAVMRAQLKHLQELASLFNVRVQILPLNAANGLALMGSLTLLDNPDHSRYAYIEGHKTGALYADAGKVSELVQTHGMIRMHALSIEESVQYIGKVASEL
ncbi:helix-turn-helix domain-containing protein [Streptomyces sp. NPDC007088]|uniref:helix-turn-helix domain-containing protein n=1 Tax=Streptomyces sp. NPDC007088 TaxID=3364773 RepID=UPI0036AB8289